MMSFEKMAGAAFERLPERVRKKVKNVAILIEDVPDETIRREHALESDTDLLGLYQGIPLTLRDNDAGFMFPDSITLYRKAIEQEAKGSDKSIEDVVYETLWHEIGHYFGLDEGDVEKREKEEFER